LRAGWPGGDDGDVARRLRGAEKRDSILWRDNSFVGAELNPDLSDAKGARACGFKGVAPTLVEVALNQELDEPFRRDAMNRDAMKKSASAAPTCAPRRSRRTGGARPPSSLSPLRAERRDTGFAGRAPLRPGIASSLRSSRRRLARAARGELPRRGGP
jgi:hypothetical protein